MFNCDTRPRVECHHIHIVCLIKHSALESDVFQTKLHPKKRAPERIMQRIMLGTTVRDH